MSKLPDTARVSLRGGAVWKYCARCDLLFPAMPGQQRCRHCDTAEVEEQPALLPVTAAASACCPAAHPEDRSPCDGPADAVRVVDQVDDELPGCVHHASLLLASVEGARVYPGGVPGAAVEAFTRAQSRRPFEFDPVAGWPGSASAGLVAKGGR